MDLVIGSGPAGVAAARALLARGRPVTLIDAGLRLEPERRAAVDRMRTQPREAWDPRFLADMRSATAVSAGGVALKLAYGSDYAVRGVDEHVLHDDVPFRFPSSLAEGGLSAVWGGAFLPWTERDLAGWPVRLADLVPHYRAVLSMVRLAAGEDDLRETHPLYTDRPIELRPSHQAGELRADLERSRVPLRARGFSWGGSRLAMRPAGDGDGAGCVYCGLCLHGCPYGLIYNTGEAVDGFRRDPRFAHRPGILVDRIVEDGGGVQVIGRTLADGSPCRFAGARAFLAGGVFSTARVLLNSWDETGEELTAAYNQHFLLPLLRLRATPGVVREDLHTLAQLFICYAGGPAVDDDIFLQVYTYNDFYGRALASMLGRAYRPVRGLIERHLLGRLLILQGYLHSKASPTLGLRLRADTRRVAVCPVPDRRARPRIRSAARALLLQTARIRALPLVPFLAMSKPGTGAHVGCTLPMRREPGRFETDVLGRPRGAGKIHVVDASVLPDLPPATITFTIMANAHRIASEAPV